MEMIKLNLVDEICKEQDFDGMLLDIIKDSKDNRINKILKKVDENTEIEEQLKKQIYEEIFEYVNDINENFKMNLQEIFLCGVNKTINKLNESFIDRLLEGNRIMKPKIKIIIADDNKGMCDLLKTHLGKYDDIEILGIANTDEEEINMIENLKPEIVITDLVRNRRYTGLDIIKSYYANKKGPAFLVISADTKEEVINNGLEVAGYIKKPFTDFNKIYEEVRKVKKELDNKKYSDWNEKYHKEEILKIKDLITLKDRRTLKKLGITIKNKSYTEYELECLTMDLLEYYDDPEEDLSEVEKQYQKSLEGTNVSREEYNKLLEKINKIIEDNGKN